MRRDPHDLEHQIEFGAWLRSVRLALLNKDPDVEDSRFGLRPFSRLVGFSSAYLCNIERGQVKPPRPDHLKIMSSLLEVDYEEMLERSGRIEDDLHDLLVLNPGIRKIARSAGLLSPEDQEAVNDIVSALVGLSAWDLHAVLSGIQQMSGQAVEEKPRTARRKKAPEG